jgi:hypothetical protein
VRDKAVRKSKSERSEEKRRSKAEMVEAPKKDEYSKTRPESRKEAIDKSTGDRRHIQRSPR